MDNESTREYDIVLARALNRNTAAARLQRVIIPNFASETVMHQVLMGAPIEALR